MPECTPQWSGTLPRYPSTVRLSRAIRVVLDAHLPSLTHLDTLNTLDSWEKRTTAFLVGTRGLFGDDSLS
jgi:hypothetical protein